MSLRMIVAACAIAILGLASFTTAASAFPAMRCVPNADKSSVVIMAVNPGDTAYACTISCHVKLAGQSQFQGYTCDASVAPGTVEAIACELEGDGPGHFTDARPDTFTCFAR